jgi:hypothetical protein
MRMYAAVPCKWREIRAVLLECCPSFAAAVDKSCEGSASSSRSDPRVSHEGKLPADSVRAIQQLLHDCTECWPCSKHAAASHQHCVPAWACMAEVERMVVLPSAEHVFNRQSVDCERNRGTAPANYSGTRKLRSCNTCCSCPKSATSYYSVHLTSSLFFFSLRR